MPSGSSSGAELRPYETRRAFTVALILIFLCVLGT
jgi:hypothetical protein